MDYSTMNLDELQAQFVDLGAQLVTISNSRQCLLGIIQARQAAAAAKVDFSSLSALDKDALRAMLDTPAPVQPVIEAAVAAVAAQAPASVSLTS